MGGTSCGSSLANNEVDRCDQERDNCPISCFLLSFLKLPSTCSQLFTSKSSFRFLIISERRGDLESLVRMARVCSRWRYLCLHDPEIEKVYERGCRRMQLQRVSALLPFENEEMDPYSFKITSYDEVDTFSCSSPPFLSRW